MDKASCCPAVQGWTPMKTEHRTKVTLFTSYITHASTVIHHSADPASTQRRLSSSAVRRPGSAGSCDPYRPAFSQVESTGRLRADTRTVAAVSFIIRRLVSTTQNKYVHFWRSWIPAFVVVTFGDVNSNFALPHCRKQNLPHPLPWQDTLLNSLLFVAFEEALYSICISQRVKCKNRLLLHAEHI